jgi:hypothetical protein
MIIYLNYTFSVPDKRLYTLYKGITVTPRVVQASSVSSHGQATFTRGASCLMLRTVPPLHVCCSHVPWHHLGGAKATVRAAPSAPNRPMTLPRSQSAPETPRTDRLQP